MAKQKSQKPVVQSKQPAAARPTGLTIDTGEIKLLVNDDPHRVIKFNPTDATFAQRFFSLIETFENKSEEYRKRFEVLESFTDVDGNGLPLNLQERISLLTDTCDFIRAQIDIIFGAGTSQAAFEDAKNIEMFIQFFDQLSPFIQAVRTHRLKKYVK